MDRMPSYPFDSQIPTPIQQFYIDFIKLNVEEQVRDQLEKALQHPIRMTMEDIEKAFGHKIEIIQQEEK